MGIPTPPSRSSFPISDLPLFPPYYYNILVTQQQSQIQDSAVKCIIIFVKVVYVVGSMIRCNKMPIPNSLLILSVPFHNVIHPRCGFIKISAIRTSPISDPVIRKNLVVSVGIEGQPHLALTLWPTMEDQIYL